MLIFKRRLINKTELLINEIYEALMSLDVRYIKYGNKIDESISLRKLTLKMNELWDNYWELSKDAHKIQIRYVGYGKSSNLIDVLEHLLFTWYLVVIDKLKIHNLSQNWVNFSISKKTQNLISK